MKKHFIYSFGAMLLISMFFFGIVSSASAQVAVTDIQAAIKAAGATWVAAENPISKLSFEEQKRLLGVKNAPKTNTHPPAMATLAYGLPPSLDWRNNGGNYVTGIRNQSACGSCWAHSAIAALESATLIANKTPNTELNLSEQVLISCCSSLCSPSGDCNGGYVEKAADFLRDHGAPAESCYPYVMNGYCADACPNWQASAYKIKNWKYVVDYDKSEGPSVDAIKAGLQYGPLAITYAVYADFMSYSSGVYKHVSGILAGFHAVLVVGYDDPGQYFIVKNSWGTGWGEQGYFRIAYSEVTGDSQFGFETIAYYVGDDPDPTCKHELADYFPASGGTGTIQMSIRDGFNWAASSDDYWIQVPGFNDWHTGPGPATFTLSPNTTTSTRTGAVVAFDDSYRQKTFPVVQGPASSQCTYTVSPKTIALDYSGGKGSINVTTGSGCPWAYQYLLLGTWVQYLQSGSGQVPYDFIKNPDVNPRTVVIKVADQDVTFNQAGTPVYFNPTSQNIPANGGSGTVAVTTDAQFYWTPISNADWIIITSDTLHLGNGKFSYFVSANTGASSRTGTVTVGSYTFAITQAGGSSCTFSAFPASLAINNGYNLVEVSITASAPDCFWQTASHASWLVVGIGGSVTTGSGNGLAQYTVWGTTDPSPRTGTITIADKTVTVKQDGQTCLNSISSQSQTFTSSGGTGTINVTAPPDCYWYATPALADWLTVTSGGNGTRGNGTVTYAAAANAGTKSRQGFLNIGLATLTVNQVGGGTCNFSISQTSQNMSASGGTGIVNVSTASGCTWWAAVANVPWITITSGLSGSGSGTVNYSVASNTNAASRSGTLVIAGKAFTVTQAGGSSCTYTLSPTSKSFTSSGGTATVSVTAASGCAWSATSTADWLTVTGGSSGSGNGTVTYSVAANTANTTTRQYSLTIGTATHWVSQAGSGSCTYTLSPGSGSFTASGGTGTVNVTAGSGCSWGASTNDSLWVAITSGTSGSGNGTMTYAVAPNTGTSSRSWGINIAGQTFGVSQGGSNCTYTVSLSGNSFTAAGGVGNMNITAGSGCAWSVASNSTSWLTLPYNPSGSGNGTLNYYVAANTAGTSRSGTLTVMGQTFTVSQAAAVPCTYSISPTSQSFTSAAGTGSVAVTAGSGCAWTAASSASWMTITGGSNGTGNGPVNYSVAANTSTSARNGTLTIAGQTFNVSQAAQACTYAISPTGKSFSAAASTGTVSVTSGSGCAWSASSNNTSWLTVTSGGSGSGNGTVSYAVTQNTSTTARNATLTIGGQTFSVAQEGAAPCMSGITPIAQSFSAAAGTGSVSVTASSGCTWSATSNNTSWLTITSGGSGSGNGTVSYAIGANPTGAMRSGTLTIGSLTHTVIQVGGSTCTYSISPTSNSFTSAAGTGSVSVTAGTGCAWTATSNNASWLTVSSGASGSGNGTVSYAVTVNTGTSARTGTITVGGQTFSVNQAGQSCTYTISPTSKSFTSAAGTGSVSVTAGTGCAWTATSNNTSWLTVSSGASGSGNGTVNYTVSANTTATSRSGSLTIGGQTHSVSQAGQSCSYSITPTSKSFTSAEGASSVSITAPVGCAWTATSNNTSWLTVSSGASGSGNGTVNYAVTTNTTSAARNGTLTIGGQTHTVSQAAGAPLCKAYVAAAQYTVDIGGLMRYVGVAADSTCSWMVTSNASWITAFGSGQGNGMFMLSVDGNSGGPARTGTLSVNGTIITINQNGR